MICTILVPTGASPILRYNSKRSLQTQQSNDSITMDEEIEGEEGRDIKRPKMECDLFSS